MITIIPIEPLNQAHGTLIVAAFNKHFIDAGGLANGEGDGDGYGFGQCYDNGNGRGDGYGDKIPEEWRAE